MYTSMTKEQATWGMRVVGPRFWIRRSINNSAKLTSRIRNRSCKFAKSGRGGCRVQIFSNATNWIDRVDAICVELHDQFRPGCTEVFNAATTDFPIRWRRGELHCVTRSCRLNQDHQVPKRC